VTPVARVARVTPLVVDGLGPQLSSVVPALAPVVVLAAVVVAVLVLLSTRDPWTALPVLMDLLLAAGLLRLTAAEGWEEIGAAGAVVLLRQVLRRGLARSRSARSGPAPAG